MFNKIAVASAVTLCAALTPAAAHAATKPVTKAATTTPAGTTCQSIDSGRFTTCEWITYYKNSDTPDGIKDEVEAWGSILSTSSTAIYITDVETAVISPVTGKNVGSISATQKGTSGTGSISWHDATVPCEGSDASKVVFKYFLPKPTNAWVTKTATSDAVDLPYCVPGDLGK